MTAVLDAPPVRATRAVLGIAAAKVAFFLATSGLYGLHRDEFYYLAAGNHPAWGYVDQPPVTPLLYRLAQAVGGGGKVSLHVLPALLAGVLVVLGGALARELGGGRWAQIATALTAALGSMYMTTAHFLSTVSVDLVLWSLATLLLLRLIRTEDPRLWVPLGLVVGVGLLNKDTMGLWVVAMGLALLATPARRLIRGWWFVAGALAACALFAPNIDWQLTHHWATLQFTSGLRHRLWAENLVEFIPTIAGLAGPVAAVFLVIGWRQTDRLLRVAVPAVILIVLVSGGKGYYAGSIYLPLIAAGAVAIERVWSASSRRRLLAWMVAFVLVMLPLFTPLLPMGFLRVVPLQSVNADLGGMLGWRSAVEQIAAVDHAVGPATAILTSDYSEAAAATYWQRQYDLPPAISGHNNYWLWGWGPAGDGPIITVGLTLDQDRRLFGSVTPAGTIHGDLIDSQVKGAVLAVCSAPRAPWPQLWPELKHYE